MLRRFATTLRHQDWTAVVLELVVVVVGVFLGVQASNWNAARADAQLGRNYVQHLRADLTLDRRSVDAEVSYYSAVLESVRRTDELLRSDHPDPRALVVNAYRASEIVYNAPVRATWDQIVASGHLGLLPARAIESGLSQYYSFDSGRDLYNQGLASRYRHTVRKIIPIDLQVAIRKGCSDVQDASGLVIGFAKHCKLDVDPAVLTATADALRADPAVAADLRYQYNFAVNAVNSLRAQVVSLDDSLKALGKGPAGSSTRAQ